MTLQTINGNLGPGSRALLPGPAELFPVMEQWRLDGREMTVRHFTEFERLLDTADRQAASGDLLRAATSLQIAANYAVLWHPGEFTSDRLENALRSLGKAALPAIEGKRRSTRPSGRMKVLHVASRVAGIGGVSRMLWRWIGNDPDNGHSVALTRQVDGVPAPLSDAVAASGGQICRLNYATGGIFAWARRLQAVLAEADIVVFHVYNFDIIPFLALAAMRNPPPVLLLNHADHLPWLGSSFIDLVVNTRRSGLELCVARRGIPRERNALMPLCLEPMTRTLFREEAKQTLGLPEDSVVLLTIARSVKYRSIGGVSFADALVPVLCGDQRVHLVAVGTGGAVDWAAAMAAVPGRIHLYEERPDTATFLQAADIYIDSFPVSSITSLFEAGLFGLPLVTRYAFGPGCEVMGADSPGLDGVMVRTESLSEYQAELASLVADPVRRTTLGQWTKANIEEINLGYGWREALAAIYDRAFDLAPRETDSVNEAPRATDLDVFMPFIFGGLNHGRTEADRMASAMEIDLQSFPLIIRLQAWLGLARRRGFVLSRTSQAWRYLLPEWLLARVKGVLRTWR